MSSLDISHGVESVIDSPLRSPSAAQLPEKKDFVPQGDRIPNFINHYFHQDDLLNDSLIEFAKPKLMYPHLMTPGNFRRILGFMGQLLRQKANENPAKAQRLNKALKTLDELEGNMELLMVYLASLYKA